MKHVMSLFMQDQMSSVRVLQQKKNEINDMKN